jgi:hypothetical protein
MDVSPGVRLDINITENQIFIQQGLSSTPGYVYLTAKEGRKAIIYEQILCRRPNPQGFPLSDSTPTPGWIAGDTNSCTDE